MAENKPSSLYSEKPKFSTTKEIVNREYAPATVDSHRGILGTVIPSALSSSPGVTGAAFEIHPKDPLPFHAVIEGEGGKETTVYVSSRAHRLLRQHNRDGKVTLGFVEAIRLAEEEEKMEKSGAVVPEVEAVAPAVVQEAVPEKRGRPRKVVEQPVAPQRALVVTIDGPAGSMVLRARDAFLGGLNNMCLVIVQDQQLGTVYLPPVASDDPAEFTISFDGRVYKAVPALYYQLPDTTVFHTVYLVM